MIHKHARTLARMLLRLQVCTLEEIAEALELELPEVQELAAEVYDERAEQMAALRQIMNDIKGKRIERHDDFNEPDTTAAAPAPPADDAAAEAYARDEARDDAFLDGYDHGHRDAKEEIAARLLQQSRLPFPSIAGYTGLTDDEVRQLAARVLKR